MTVSHDEAGVLTVHLAFYDAWAWAGAVPGARYIWARAARPSMGSPTASGLMISDLAYAVRQGRTPRRAYRHGTNTAGFGTIVAYRCETRGRTVTCTNKLGDAFRWTR